MHIFHLHVLHLLSESKILRLLLTLFAHHFLLKLYLSLGMIEFRYDPFVSQHALFSDFKRCKPGSLMQIIAHFLVPQPERSSPKPRGSASRKRGTVKNENNGRQHITRVYFYGKLFQRTLNSNFMLLILSLSNAVIFSSVFFILFSFIRSTRRLPL